MLDASTLAKGFSDRFGAPHALVVRAPGRVNLIGEHTDYNDGFVLPLAIDLAVWIALRPRSDGRVCLHSLQFGDSVEFTADAPEHGGPAWAEYPRGVASALAGAGLALKGWEGVMAGDVPLGAGLSSSAALELATARAFAAVSGLEWQPKEMARLCQRAENEWVGVQCGIMDQLISAIGEPDRAVLIDCRTLHTRPVPLPPETAVVIMDTATRRGLVESAYNERRLQCEQAARFFGVSALRDLSSVQLAARGVEMDEAMRSRARHVVSEDERTLAAAEAMQRGDAVRLGRLMNESHDSLRDDFQVSTPELDRMVRAARAQPGCYGARMTGAGFGGCAVALVRRTRAEPFRDGVARDYEEATGLTPWIHITDATAGASIVEEERRAAA